MFIVTIKIFNKEKNNR
uniref:Uncharacterized protein n=1 Tax=Rhizophora mucronata TaxID=61149 RepID=A0A2P2QB01_RHIMU